ncbi:hypothetical protein BB559_000416 [Furculomyces boomerangus]|uniref:2-oxoisovalerate dehydrogenase subunit alpha n=1 Tax=Furculomyces boomerangus TaxID=61424 RepID=A0A2T9Z5B2_9FUNG|nr:hypothetical protein BB559_000416 [Furculomyces boomerangus]
MISTIVKRTFTLARFYPNKGFSRCFSSSLDFHKVSNLEVTNKLEFVETKAPTPMYSAMDKTGKILDKENTPTLSKEETQAAYRNMLTINLMDQILYEAQRQGRISFYMTSFGEEAVVGTALALQKKDYIFSQYREGVVFLQRGMSIEEMMNQSFSNQYGHGKGRQMPIHYGSKELNLVTISSPLATQIPQAVGTAFALKREGNGSVVICYFGEGSASEGDFHAALNMAATIECPVIFYCRNNGYAISTPASEQYKGDGIVGRGEGYGIKSIRVDGNDVWAVYTATKMAREYAEKNNKPVLIEAMTYRVGHHSTSDDSSAYRSKGEVEDWSKRDNPISRLRKYMESKGWWGNDDELEAKSSLKARVLKALAEAETAKKPSINDLYAEVYDTIPQNLADQLQKTKSLAEKYPDYYKINEFKS